MKPAPSVQRLQLSFTVSSLLMYLLYPNTKQYDLLITTPGSATDNVHLTLRIMNVINWWQRLLCLPLDISLWAVWSGLMSTRLEWRVWNRGKTCDLCHILSQYHDTLPSDRRLRAFSANKAKTLNSFVPMSI